MNAKNDHRNLPTCDIIASLKLPCLYAHDDDSIMFSSTSYVLHHHAFYKLNRTLIW